jgi:hypothetical protein
MSDTRRNLASLNIDAPQRAFLPEDPCKHDDTSSFYFPLQRRKATPVLSRGISLTHSRQAGENRLLSLLIHTV